MTNDLFGNYLNKNKSHPNFKAKQLYSSNVPNDRCTSEATEAHVADALLGLVVHQVLGLVEAAGGAGSLLGWLALGNHHGFAIQLHLPIQLGVWLLATHSEHGVIACGPAKQMLGMK